MSPLIDEDALREWTGFHQSQRLMRWLVDNGIPFLRGRDGRVITTQGAVDAVLLQRQTTGEPIEFD